MMISARVHSVLENGVMLSFLTYFSGTVSAFLTVYYFFL
jgi:rRNA biogenesis protein RRP5